MKLTWPQRFLGYGPSADHAMSALWEPVSNRFILVSPRQDILATISRFTFRKFRTIVVQFDRSVACDNLVDNDVCLNWGMTNTDHVSLSNPCWHAVSCPGLVELGPYPRWPLADEQDFFIAAHQLLEYLDTESFLRYSATKGYMADWLPCYHMVRLVIKDSVLEQHKLELHNLLQDKAKQIIFRCHTLHDLDQAWHDVLQQHNLLDHWQDKVQRWHA